MGSALQKGNLVVYAGIAGFSFVETVVKETLENTSGLKAGEDFGVAYNPIVYSFQNPLKQIGEEELTVAADDKSSLNAAALIYQTIAKKGVKKIGNVKTAELAMLFAAVKTDVNEALVNEMAIFCEEAGIDFAEIIKLLENSLCDTAVVPTISEENNRDKAYLLLENVENFDAKLRLSRLARQINEDMVRYAANLTQEALRDSGKTFRRAKVALLGAAEPGTAGAAFVDLLKAKGAKVSRYDPDGSAGTQQEAESLLKKTLNETVEGTDCVVILSGKEQLKRLNLKKLRALMKSPAALVDLVGAVDPENAEGFSYRGLGRGNLEKMKKLGVAVIGTGFWGKNHARVYKELECTNLVAICDVKAERAKAIADQYGVKAYTDSARMLKNPEIEAVSVCTWSTMLAKEAMKSLHAGKHVSSRETHGYEHEASREAHAGLPRKRFAPNRGFPDAVYSGIATNPYCGGNQKNRRSRLCDGKAGFPVA